MYVTKRRTLYQRFTLMSAQADPRVLDIKKEAVSSSAYILPANEAEANRWAPFLENRDQGTSTN